VEKMFEEALELAHETVLRSLETMWIRYIDSASNYSVTGTQRQQSTKDFIESFAADSFDDNNDLGNSVKPKSAHRVLGTNREFWVNTKTSISQWTRPYYPRIFRCQEIEVDIFIQILIRRDVFPNRYSNLFTVFFLLFLISSFHLVRSLSILIWPQKIFGRTVPHFINKFLKETQRIRPREINNPVLGMFSW
jgi:hypothetical protein